MTGSVRATQSLSDLRALLPQVLGTEVARPFEPGTPKESEKSPEKGCPGAGEPQSPQRVRPGVRKESELSCVFGFFSDSALIFLSLLFWKKQGKLPQKARIFSRGWTPKIPGKDRKMLKKAKEIPCNKKKARKSKKARRGRSGDLPKMLSDDFSCIMTK